MERQSDPASLPQDRERRNTLDANLRASPQGLILSGYAALFDRLSGDLGGFHEKIARGAFSDTIMQDDIRALWNHDPKIVIGRTRSGTLALWEDQKGLAFKITPPDTQLVRDVVMAPIRRGDVDQMSFGFATIKDRWLNEGGQQIRELQRVQLFDVSPVTFPAYPETGIGIAQRSLAKASGRLARQAELEQYEREMRRDEIVERLRLFIPAAADRDLSQQIAWMAADLAGLELGVEFVEIEMVNSQEGSRRQAYGWAKRGKIWICEDLCGCRVAATAAHEIKHIEQFSKRPLQADDESTEDEARTYEREFRKKYLDQIVCCHGREVG